MIFSFILIDKPDAGDLRQRIRPEHKAYLAGVAERMAFAGPLVADDGQTMLGSLLAIDFPSRDAARVEEIAACLNLMEGTRLEDVQSASAHHLPPTGQPRHWRICQDLEPDARGKISRASWRERWARLP